MRREYLSQDQLRGLWDGVYKLALESVTSNIFGESGLVTELVKLHGLGIRLVRPKAVQTNELELWQKDPGLVDESGHLISRILIAGVDERTVRKGKAIAYLRMDRRDNKLITLVWSDQEIGNVGLEHHIGAEDDSWYVRAPDSESRVEVVKNNVLFTAVLLPKVNLLMPAGLPAGYKQVFDHKTGMMIARP
ncbi:MAG: hypothetical protein V1810_03695 [Candidatus Beckwithbacteria bacterium]